MMMVVALISAFYTVKRAVRDNYEQQVQTHNAWLNVMREWHNEMQANINAIELELEVKTSDRFFKSDFNEFLDANPELNQPKWT